MYLRKLVLKNYRLFAELEVPLHEKLTVLLGVNGSGKTSVLEGATIAMGTLFTKMDGISSVSIEKTDAHLESFELGNSDDVQALYPVKIHAEGIIDGQEFEWTRSLNTSKGSMTVKESKNIICLSESIQERLREGDKNLVLPIIAYYGTGRLWDNHREKKKDVFKANTRTNGYIDSLDGTANIKLMMAWFQKMTVKEYQRQKRNQGSIQELDVVYRALEKSFASITGFENVNIEYNMDTGELDIYYTDLQGYQMRIPLSQMSAGYKGAISLIADIAYRMATLNPQLLDHVLTDTDGIVLIDEVDLHLHPQWQKQILSNLTTIFPKVQFVVSTHAPAIINSVHSENLVIFKDAQIVSVNSQVYGKDIKSVLSEIMGVEDRPDDISELFAEFYDTLNKRAYDDAEQILDQIDRLREYHDPEVSNCRVKLKLERIRGGRK